MPKVITPVYSKYGTMEKILFLEITLRMKLFKRLKRI